MRRIVLVVILFCAAPAYAVPYGQFHGYITSLETLTSQGTYVNALGSQNAPLMSGSLGFTAPISDIASSCGLLDPTNPNLSTIYCSGGGFFCSSPLEVSITSSAVSMDNYEGNLSCPDGSFSVTGSVSGSVTGLDFYPNGGSPPYVYEGITLDFQGPPLPTSDSVWDFPDFASQWTGSGSFFHYVENAQFQLTAAYQGTFEIVPASELPEPGALALFAAGLAGIAVGLRRRWVRRAS